MCFSNIVNTVVQQVPGPPALTDEQNWILRMAYEEARRARAMQTNDVQITRVGSGTGQVDTINVYDDDGSLLYTITVTGEDCDNRTITYSKNTDLGVDGRNVYCPLPEIPDDPCP